LIEQFIIQQLARILGSRPGDLDTALSLPELGLDSLMGLELRNKIRRTLDLQLSATIAWSFPTLAELARHVADEWIDSQLRDALTASPVLESELQEEIVL
jgi:acyl carrier protein